MPLTDKGTDSACLQEDDADDENAAKQPLVVADIVHQRPTSVLDADRPIAVGRHRQNEALALMFVQTLRDSDVLVAYEQSERVLGLPMR